MSVINIYFLVLYTHVIEILERSISIRRHEKKDVRFPGFGPTYLYYPQFSYTLIHNTHKSHFFRNYLTYNPKNGSHFWMWPNVNTQEYSFNDCINCKWYRTTPLQPLTLRNNILIFWDRYIPGMQWKFI